MNDAIMLRIDAFMVPLQGRDPERYAAILQTSRIKAQPNRQTDPDLDPCLTDFDEVPGDISPRDILAWNAWRAALEALIERDGPFVDVIEVAA